MTLQKLIKEGFKPLPPTAATASRLIQDLGQNSPDLPKLRQVWNFYKWISKYGGIKDLRDNEYLQNKIDALRYDLQTYQIKVRKQAIPIHIKAVRALEEATDEALDKDDIVLQDGTRVPHVAHLTKCDRIASSQFRDWVGASARVNDAQHTSPETYKETSKTLEFTAWQTKVSSAADISSRPMPLIATKDSLTGVSWWLPMSEYMQTKPAQDYMLPAPNKSRTQFRGEPATSQQILRWIRLILTQKGIEEDIVDAVTLGSLRVWMPDLAYQAGVARDRRRYLGRWAFDSTADVYTREHRAVVTDIW